MPRNGSDCRWRPGTVRSAAQPGAGRQLPLERALGDRPTYRLTTGTPRTPIVGAFYDADFNGYTRIIGEPGSARNPTFSQLDLRIERSWTFDYWVLGVYLDVLNVLYRKNPEGTFTTTGSERARRWSAFRSCRSWA